MFWKKRLVLLILSISWCECQHICQLIRPKGYFDGINAYTLYKEEKLTKSHKDKYWTGNYEYWTEYWMYKDNFEWKFHLYPGKHFIDINYDTQRKIGTHLSPIVLQFSALIGKPESGGALKKRIADACYVTINSNNKTNLFCKRGALNSQLFTWNETDTEFDQDMTIAFNPNAGDSSEYIIIMSKRDRNRYKFFSVIRQRLYNKDDKHCKQCILPKFVQQIRKEWVIDAILSYGWNEKEKGHLILLNIRKKPFYCFIPKGKESENCKYENILPYGFDCQKSDKGVESDNDTHQKSDGFPFYWIVIIVLAIISIAVILMIAVFTFKNNKKMKKMSKLKNNKKDVKKQKMDNQKKKELNQNKHVPLKNELSETKRDEMTEPTH